MYSLKNIHLYVYPAVEIFCMHLQHDYSILECTMNLVLGMNQQNYSAIIYNFHHCTKLYRKISRVYCRLYCYECAARVTMPMATNE